MRSVVVFGALCCLGAGSAQVLATELTTSQQLGKSIFFDRDLSLNRNQSCSACHKPESGWTGPLASINQGGAVYEGSIPDRFGNRKPPSSAYATPSPVLHYEVVDNQAVFVGGNFWDGRATGEKLGNPAADQAQGPFLNPVEQALPDNACVVHRVCNPTNPGQYPVGLEDVWGVGACSIAWPSDVDAQCESEDGHVVLSDEDRDKVDAAYNYIALSIAAFEDSPESNQYTSKYDYFLQGEVRLTGQERRGLALFRGKARCANCHVLDRGDSDEPPLFTDYAFENLGIPRNPENPWYTMPAEFNPAGENWIDEGLGGFLATRMDYQHLASENYGKHKVPTLRNVDLRPGPGFVKAYGHNGYFKSLKSIVHFYNTRDVKPPCPNAFTREEDALAMECWPEPEVSVNVNTTDLGDLRLSDNQEDAIVAFLKTLTDGYELDGDDDHGHGRNGDHSEDEHQDEESDDGS
jgi:cytochrome c peroxidase